MKRVSILIVCALWLCSARPAVAGTWSWHSDLIQQVIARIIINRENNLTVQPSLRGSEASRQSPSGHLPPAQASSRGLPGAAHSR